MKILVFSDSHGKLDKMYRAVELHKNNTDAVIFLGDGIVDFNYLKDYFTNIALYEVKGNCDLFCGSVPNERVVSIDGIKILITHSHLYPPSNRYEALAKKAYDLGADAVFFGHTHQIADDIIEVEGSSIHIFNPGSVGHEGYYGVVNTSNGVLVTSHKKII